ncbi:hypothetical protein FOXYSP1_18278 [Fusarium oxysporum f. sp. phaseoli]
MDLDKSTTRRRHVIKTRGSKTMRSFVAAVTAQCHSRDRLHRPAQTGSTAEENPSISNASCNHYLDRAGKLS